LTAGVCTTIDLKTGIENTVDQLADYYLAAGFTKVSKLRQEAMVTFLQTFLRASLGVTIASVLATIPIYFLIYRRIISSLDREIKGVSPAACVQGNRAHYRSYRYCTHTHTHES
jgi:hypothetical protein